MSDHQSNLDPMVHLRALPLSLRVLAMRELFRIPLLGRAMRTAGMIEVDRDSPDFRQIDQAAARSLAAGHSLLVYPEGTAVLIEYQAHYDMARPHQGIGQSVPGAERDASAPP